MSNDTFNCPRCGTLLKVIPLSGGGDHRSGGWQRGQSFPMGKPPAGSSYSRTEPAADLSGVEAGVKAPALQAALTGLAALGVTVILTAWQDWPWFTPVIVAVITAALAWWLLLLDTRQMLRLAEHVSGRDLDGDGEVGFSVEITEPLADGRKRMKFAHFPARRVQVLDFAQAMINGQLTIYGHHNLSRGMFTKLRDEAIARGLICWTDPDAHAQGIELTRAGEHVFERLLLEG